MKVKILLLLASLLALPSSSPAATPRATVTLAEGWKFIRQDAAVDAPTGTWSDITVPHTWNARDGQNGKAADPDQPAGYYRGPGWYARNLEIPAAWAGRRVFLRFEAASLVADVYLNGRALGQHRGGFAAFCLELTPYLRIGERNELRVRVDNTRFEDIAPLSGDFTVGGGLYRPVHLLVTAPLCFTPLDHATSGVYLTPRTITADEAVVDVEAKVSNPLAAGTPCTVQVDLEDATGRAAGSARAELVAAAGATTSARAALVIRRPHLWQGRPDPYLYRVRVRLLHEGQVVDEVGEPLGLRTVAIDPQQGFLLNGRPYALHGVNRHQELADKGWALSDADHAADLAMIMEIGATALRLAHYQQSSVVHDLCDRNGLVVWQEVPVVERVSATPEFAANARQQLTEMILQGWNHPSLAMWGIYNELRATWLKEPWPAPEPVIEDLQRLARTLDPSRPTVAATWSANPLPVHTIPEAQCLNTYPGWYTGQIDDFAASILKLSDSLGGRRIGISEYGAGANPAQHEEGELHKPEPGGPFHPEEWQALTHERQWAIAKANPRVWGTFVWAMFDFASDSRSEGGAPGINDKGLVTHDRRLRKDAFYFYQANWTDRPMVHLAERRLTPRRQAVTTVKAYANCAALELRVNGRSLGSARPDEVRVFRWRDVTLQPGRNQVEVIGPDGVADRCEWVLETAP